MSLAENIKMARIAAGLTQRELSDLSKVSQSMIAQYESGKRIPKIGALSSIAHTLGCKVSDLDSDINWLDYQDRQFERSEIAERLAFVREDFGISIDEAGEILGIAPLILQSYEDCTAELPVDSLEKIGEAYQKYLDIFKDLHGEDFDYRRIEADIRFFFEAYDFENLSLLANELRLSASEEKILYHFLILNELGRKVAIDRVKELTEIKRYTEHIPLGIPSDI